MSFIRAKEIPPRSGNWYDYEVKTTHVNGHVRQKVIRYLGKSGRHSYLSGGGHVLTSNDYKVSLHPRKSVKKGKPVVDATLTPITNPAAESA